MQRPPIQVSISHTSLIGEGYTMIYVTHPEDNDIAMDKESETQYLYNLVSFDEETGGVKQQIQIKDHQNILFNLVSEVRNEDENPDDDLVLLASKSQQERAAKKKSESFIEDM